MSQAIKTLLVRYEQLLNATDSPEPDWVNHYNDLRLVDACQDKILLNSTQPDHPFQLGIVGPTQAGKSTLVNVLTGHDAAGVSARAGYTVHAQGFGVDLEEHQLQPICSVLEPMVRVTPEALRREELNTYLLEPIQSGDSALIRQAVVWDSPDFDSIEAHGYRGAVLDTVALSDALILVVSKDKYGDRSVWDMLRLMLPLDKPITVLINKLNEHDKATVLTSFEERFKDTFPNETPATLVALPYTEDQRPFTPIELQGLTDAVQHSENHHERQRLQPAVNHFINQHWERWIKPAIQEQSAEQLWQAAVHKAIDRAFEQYQSRYLNDESRNDTFNRALAELLTLLEIPGIAATLQKTREVVTWPVRTLFGFGVNAIKAKTQQAPPADIEQDVLSSLRAHVVTELQGIALDAQQEYPEQARWWQALSQELRNDRDTIANHFDSSALAYQQAFEPRIEEAAAKLYQQLETQPTLLNSLRAARVTGDAAAVALAVKSGGLAATDLLVAPAMLSVTTLLTESALGRYMNSVKAELKREQGAVVQAELFQGVLGTALLSAPNTMDRTQLLGIDPTSLDDPMSTSQPVPNDT